MNETNASAWLTYLTHKLANLFTKNKRLDRSKYEFVFLPPPEGKEMVAKRIMGALNEEKKIVIFHYAVINEENVQEVKYARNKMIYSFYIKLVKENKTGMLHVLLIYAEPSYLDKLEPHENMSISILYCSKVFENKQNAVLNLNGTYKTPIPIEYAKAMANTLALYVC